MPALFIIEAANIFVNDVDKSLSARHIAVPKLEEIKHPHFAGGSPGEIEISIAMRQIEIEFSLVGVEPATLAYFGASLLVGGFGNRFTIYECLRDKITNNPAGVIMEINGRISRAEPEPFRRGDLAGTVFGITEITWYRLTVAGSEIYRYSWLTGEFLVNGVEQNIAPVVIAA